MKTLFLAGLLCLAPLVALADGSVNPAAGSSQLPPATADNYMACANYYLMRSQMKPRDEGVNYPIVIQSLRVMAIVSSSEAYVNSHLGPMLDAEMKKFNDAQQIGTLPMYMSGFKYRLQQCAEIMNTGASTLGPKMHEYLKEKQAAAAAAASGK